MLQCVDLGFDYDGRTLYRDISLTVSPGETVAILGRSGCGKSTFLRQVAGLLEGDGESSWDDIRVSPDRRLTSYVPQDAGLLPHLTVFENVALAAKLGGRGDITEHLEQVGLRDAASCYPSALSGGMRARVAFARAMMLARPILLLDEPFASLDARTRSEMQNWLRQLLHSSGMATLLVTHSIDEAFLLADRVYFMDGANASFKRCADRTAAENYFGLLETFPDELA